MLRVRARDLRAMHAESLGRRGHAAVRLHRVRDGRFVQSTACLARRMLRGRAACAGHGAGHGHGAMAQTLPNADGLDAAYFVLRKLKKTPKFRRKVD